MKRMSPFHPANLLSGRVEDVQEVLGIRPFSANREATRQLIFRIKGRRIPMVALYDGKHTYGFSIGEHTYYLNGRSQWEVKIDDNSMLFWQRRDKFTVPIRVESIDKN